MARAPIIKIKTIFDPKRRDNVIKRIDIKQIQRQVKDKASK